MARPKNSERVIIKNELLSTKSRVLCTGIAFGLAWGILMATTAIGGIFGWGTEFISIMSSLYPGYGPSVIGALSGFVWAFIDGFIWGAIFMVVYYKLIKICARRKA